MCLVSLALNMYLSLCCLSVLTDNFSQISLVTIIKDSCLANELFIVCNNAFHRYSWYTWHHSLFPQISEIDYPIHLTTTIMSCSNMSNLYFPAMSWLILMSENKWYRLEHFYDINFHFYILLCDELFKNIKKNVKLICTLICHLSWFKFWITSSIRPHLLWRVLCMSCCLPVLPWQFFFYLQVKECPLGLTCQHQRPQICHIQYMQQFFEMII